ncbi:Gfo/Idh/MocA family oxidoreductase [Streptomyces sp. NPDC006430]|uniref:Gfo/Idh/MocA family protein n=1 Tax=Streptomyces sp. NPDC006430 TaxID=3154299 RepID=UPI00339FDF10
MAIVGYGTVGPLHALAYQVLPRIFPGLPRVPEVALVVDPDPASLARARAEWSVPARPPADRLYDAFGIDVVDCCAPSPLHAPVCTDALAAGLPVLCEKPLTGSGEASASLVARAAAGNAALGVNFNFRFVPALREARRLGESGSLGEIRSLRIGYHRSSNLARHGAGNPPTDAGRGALLDLGPHAVDLVHFLFGRIARVSARTAFYDPRANAAADDLAKVDFALDNGALGSVEVSKVTPGAANDLEVFAYGTEAGVHFSSTRPDVLDVYRGTHYATAHQRLRFGVGGPADTTAVVPAETGSSVLLWHAASFAAFARRVAGERGAQIAGAVDGLGVDRVLDAARASIARSAAWVPVGPW